jgi:tetratricopeptide (TPR) repeat protein
MPSLVPGYEYDIFISYRQKDNKYDGWVTEFVDHLKSELEATFKEEIYVYFDINPHDGLLETHDVDASLREKLNCLIFIPIISRTYCDPRSFAWDHEFKVFIEQASKDKLGLKVKLPNGNISNRVLPVRIHDLDINDIKLCESILGGVLRGVEFIYKEPGVNRSLTPEDKEKKNLNGTIYRNQINKVALAIMEIMHGLQAELDSPVKETVEEKELHSETEKKKKPAGEKWSPKFKKQLRISGIVLALMLIISGIIVWPKFFKPDPLEKLKSPGGKVAIAVLPFQNLTTDTTWKVLQFGIQESLISSLSESGELQVRLKDNINTLIKDQGAKVYSSVSPSLAGALSEKLDADIYIYGSIKQAGSHIRVDAQLIDTKTKNVFKSIRVENPSNEANIFIIIDSLSEKVRNFLLLSNLIKNYPDYRKFAVTTRSPEAFRFCMLGDDIKNNFRNKKELPTAVNWYSKALAIDSNFYSPMKGLCDVFNFMGMQDQYKQNVLKLYQKREQWPNIVQLDAEAAYCAAFGSQDDQINVLRKIQQIDDQTPGVSWSLGSIYLDINQYDKAVTELEKAVNIYHKWGVDPIWYYKDLGYAYYKTRQYKKEKELYKKAEKYIHDGSVFYIYPNQARLALTEKDTDAANLLIDKYISACKENSIPEASTYYEIGRWIYREAGSQDKAEEYLRKALSLEPANPMLLNAIAWLLIDTDRNINEGLRFVNEALELSPENINYLDTKAWGVYKHGNKKEALNIWEKALELNNHPFDYMLTKNIEMAKKAIEQ